MAGHTHRHTDTHTHRQTDMVKTIPRNPLRGRDNDWTSHSEQRRQVVSHGIPPPMDPPPDKIPYGKSSPSMGSPPPPKKKKPQSHMQSQYYIWNLCWRIFAIEGVIKRFAIWYYPPLGKFCHGISSGGGGGGVAIWYYFPLGKFCYGISSWGGGGGVLPYGIPSWERLSYDIISGETICHGICSLIMKFVCVGGGDLP